MISLNNLIWSLSVLCISTFSHQVVVGEPCDLLLDAVLHLSLGRQGRGVVQDLLLLLDVVFQQLDLSVQSLQFIFVLPGLRLQLRLQQPERPRGALLFSACSPTISKPRLSVCALNHG